MWTSNWQLLQRVFSISWNLSKFAIYFLFNFSCRIISFVRFDIKTTSSQETAKLNRIRHATMSLVTSICTKTKMKLCKIQYTHMTILIRNVLIFLELNVCQFLEFQEKHKFDSVYASMYCYNDSTIAFTSILSRIYTWRTTRTSMNEHGRTNVDSIVSMNERERALTCKYAEGKYSFVK